MQASARVREAARSARRKPPPGLDNNCFNEIRQRTEKNDSDHNEIALLRCLNRTACYLEIAGATGLGALAAGLAGGLAAGFAGAAPLAAAAAVPCCLAWRCASKSSTCCRWASLIRREVLS